MRNKVLLFSILFFIFLFSSISFAIEFYNPDEIQGLSYASVFEYCQNTTAAYWWDIFDWYGTEANIYSCWDITYNATAPKTWVIKTDPNTSFASPVNYMAVGVHPLETSDFSTFSLYSDISDEWLDTITLPANREAIIYVSYKINNTTYFDQGASFLMVTVDGEQIFINETLPTTAGVYHNITAFTDVDIYNDRDLWVNLELVFSNAEVPVTIEINDFQIFTFDSEKPFIADNFTTSYGLRQCNATEYQANFYMDNGQQIFAVNETTGYRGVPCAVYLHDNVTYTRKAIEIYDGGATSTPPVSADHFFISSRDKAFVRNNDIEWSGHDTENPMLFTQIQPYLLRLYFHTSTLVFSGPKLFFSDSGSVNLTTIHTYCNTTYTDDQLCIYPLSASGSEYYFDFNVYGNTENHNVFSTSYCPPSYTCTFTGLYFTNADCSSTLIQDCGIWDCNADADGCNYPTNPENASETVSNYGSYCFENNNYSYYTLNASGIFIGSCEFPDKCRQLTDITISCATDDEFEESDSQGSLPKATSYGLAQTLGTTTTIANILVSIIVSLVGAFALTSKVKDNHSNVFFAVAIVGMVVFYYLEMIPFEMFAFIILAVAGLWFLVYQKITSTGG